MLLCAVHAKCLCMSGPLNIPKVQVHIDLAPQSAQDPGRETGSCHPGLVSLSRTLGICARRTAVDLNMRLLSSREVTLRALRVSLRAGQILRGRTFLLKAHMTLECKQVPVTQAVSTRNLKLTSDILLSKAEEAPAFSSGNKPSAGLSSSEEHHKEHVVGDSALADVKVEDKWGSG